MNPSEIENRNILFAALDWGLGHVTRSIGIIQELSQKNTITVACNPIQQKLFASYFSTLNFLPLEGYGLRFLGRGNWKMDLLMQSGKFLKALKTDRAFVHEMTKKHHFDLIISDHRYGFRMPGVESIFITHQLHLPVSKLFFAIQKWHERQLNHFQRIWVLDESNSTLAGKLSLPINHPDIRYIGFPSRLSDETHIEHKYDYLLVVSGPQPYAQQMIGDILKKMNFGTKKVAVLYPEIVVLPVLTENFELFKLSDLKTDDRLFSQSECIISRAGYSTLMDLKQIGKRGILIPTKGQAEQIYLAQHLANDSQFQFL